jgi:hypothetical protein
MKSAHFKSRLLVSLILLLVAATFLAGSLRLFHKASAAVSSGVVAASSGHPETDTSVVRGSESFRGVSATAALSGSFQAGTGLPPQATPVVGSDSADTGGIIALAIVIVVTILVGAVWGARGSTRNNKSSR